MGISYEKALQILEGPAEELFRKSSALTRTVSLLDSIGRVAADDHVSPISTPPRDTSAMDGYAIASGTTINASVEHPVTYVVKGTIAAGGEPIELANEPEDGAFPCVEIMTGAQFPRSSTKTPFDACIKVEDTVPLDWSTAGSGMKSQKRITVSRTLPLYANRRIAGGDMRQGDVILAKGDVVRSRHIMGLSSVGITEVNVRRKLRVAVWSTGNELSECSNHRNGDAQILNSNGPYLTAALRELDADVDYKGILRDDPSSLHEALSSCRGQPYDVVITTGAVSKGKFDFIVPALKGMRANVLFHGVAIRPGHPVLFATTSSDMGNIPLFGLPGNPVATAACFRFLVMPFLKLAQGQVCEQPEVAILSERNGCKDAFLASPSHLDCFRHGRCSRDNRGTMIVDISSNQSPAVISQFTASNCWVHIERGRPSELSEAVVLCYPHSYSFD